MNHNVAKKPVLTLTVVATAIVEACRAIDLDGTYTASGQDTLGVSDAKGYVGNEVAVDVLGTSTCEAGAVIAQGALIQVGSNGQFITKAAGKTVGRALSAASGAGSKFHALLIPADS